MAVIDNNVSQMCIDEMEAAMSGDDGFWPVDVQFGTVTYPPGGRLGPRIQHNLQLVMLHSGSMNVWVDDTFHHAAAHTICILFPGHEERFMFDEFYETQHSWLHISVPSLHEHLAQRLARLPWSLPLSSGIAQLTQDALELQVSPFSTSAEIRKALAMQLLWRYVGEGERHSGMQEHPVVDAARQFIATNLHEPLTLAVLASALSVSPSYLIRLFGTHLHTTPMHYIWHCRVAKGLKLLEQTGLTIGDIASKCGFQSRYHFSRKVRETTGMTPLEVRHRSWQR